MEHTIERLTAYRKRLQMYWLTIAAFAIVIAYSDGFWVTSMQGAVGAIERRQPPLTRWLHDSTLMLPVYFFAVLAGLLLARRLVGRSRYSIVKLGATALLVVVISSAVGIAEVAASSAYDYRLQTQHLALSQTFHHTHPAAQPAVAGAGAPSCTEFCAEKQLTLTTHHRAVAYGSAVLLITNFVLVVWVLALRSNRLWRPANKRHQPAEPTPSFDLIPAGT